MATTEAPSSGGNYCLNEEAVHWTLPWKRHLQAVLRGSRRSAGASGRTGSRQLPWLLLVWPGSEPPASGLLPRQPPPQRARPPLYLPADAGGPSSAAASSPWPAPARSVCAPLHLPRSGRRYGRRWLAVGRGEVCCWRSFPNWDAVADDSRPFHVFWPSLTGTMSPTTHARSTCTATLALTGLAPPSNRSSRTVPCNPSRISAELC